MPKNRTPRTRFSILSLDSEQRTRGECGGKNKYYLMAGRLWREEQVKARTYGGKNMARSRGVWYGGGAGGKHVALESLHAADAGSGSSSAKVIIELQTKGINFMS